MRLGRRNEFLYFLKCKMTAFELDLPIPMMQNGTFLLLLMEEDHVMDEVALSQEISREIKPAAIL